MANQSYYIPAFTRMTAAEDTIPFNTRENYAMISSNLAKQHWRQLDIQSFSLIKFWGPVILDMKFDPRHSK